MPRGKRGRGASGSARDSEPASIKSDVSKIVNRLAVDNPDGSVTTRRDDMVKEADMLRERILIGMPTRDEMDHPARHPGAIQKHMNWEKRTEKDRMRYRELMRMLEPDDPTATDLEKFRIDDSKKEN